MDELDLKLISLLQRDGRASNASLARHMGVSEGTIRRRLRRLMNDGVLKILAVPEPAKMGFNTIALIGIQADPDKVEEVSSSLSSLKEARYVAITTGSFDIFLWVALGSSEELGKFLRQRVGPIPGIRRTETFVNLAIRKQDFGLVGQ